MIYYISLVVIDIILVALLHRRIPLYVLIPWAFGILSTVVKPVLYYLEGSYSFHYHDATESSYLEAGVIFVLVRIATNIIFLNAKDCMTPPLHFPKSSYFTRAVLLCTLPFCFMIATNGLSWLPGSRETTLTVLNPVFRYIYPIIIYSSSILLVTIIYQFLMKRVSIPLAAFLFLLSVVVTTLISQRGMLIIAVLIAALGLYKINSIKFSVLFSFAAFVVLFGLLARVVVSDSADSMPIYDRLLLGGDGTQIDSLVCSFDFIKETIGQDINYSVFNEFFGFMPQSMRGGHGWATAGDILNFFWLGESYAESGFGYNFSNLSAFMLGHGVFLGVGFYLAWIIVLRVFLFYMSLETLNGLAVVPIYITLSSLIYSFATFHWAVFSFLIYGILCIRVTRTSIKI